MTELSATSVEERHGKRYERKTMEIKNRGKSLQKASVEKRYGKRQTLLFGNT